MQRLMFRAVPSLIVGLLLVLAMLGSLPHARVRAAGAASSIYSCTLPPHTIGGELFDFGGGSGVTQPLITSENVAACSLNISQPGADYGLARLDYVLWDPTSLAPDPTTVALRSRVFQNSDLRWNHLLLYFQPPIVTQQISHIAEKASKITALNFEAVSPGFPHGIRYASDGPAEEDEALQYGVPGPRTPLPGSHPVLAYGLCTGDAALQRQYVVQSVVTTNFLADTSNYELIQRFRVPVQVRLQWVELAFGPPAFYYPGFGVIAILDAGGTTEPMQTLPPSMVQANFNFYGNRVNAWDSHYDFDHLVTLEPGRDYWLLARVRNQYPVFTHTLTGDEGPDFTSSIGAFHARSTPGGPWTLQTGKVLNFRLIGESLDALDAPAPNATVSSLRLRVAPNPSRGAAFVTWSGASGAVRFQVLDARGRRVGGSTQVMSREGRWMWSGVSDSGRPLSPGVYFVHASDDAGQSTVERIALVR